MTEPSFSPINARIILGGPASGKTQRLIQEARSLAERGASVLFVCASPCTAENVSNVLPRNVEAADARMLALKCLAGHERTRVLAPYEEQFLMEDLRTSGLPQKQIRKILGFIYANMAALGDWDPAWIEMAEERLVYNTLMETLAFTGGTVEPELANRAARLLSEDGALREEHAFDYVLVDDYGLLNRSSQMLCNLLARKGITAAGEPGFALAVHDSHPNPAGLEEFTELHPGAKTVELPKIEARFRKETVASLTVKDEFASIVARVKDAIDQGASPDGIAVMGTNRTWLRNIAHVLEKEGIPVQTPPKQVRIRDFRDPKSAQAAYNDTLERLADDPADGVALRSLYGFGDYMARSTEVKRFREQNPGATITDLADPPSEDTLAQVRAWKASRGTDDGAAKPAVWVGHPKDSFGLAFDQVIFGGLVPGWIPATGFADAVGSKRQAMLDDARLTVSAAKRACKQTLVLSGFTSCDLEFAERLGVDYKRSRLQHGVRTCKLEPTFEAMPELF